MTTAPLTTPALPAAETSALSDVGRLFYDRGWSVGTSSNYSIILGRNPLRLLLTASGMDKGRLRPHDFVIVDERGKAVENGAPKPSAETLLHVAVAQKLPDVGAVLHTHSVWATMLTDVYRSDGAITIEGYEMLKGLSGVPTHEHTQRVEIFDNTQDIPSLADRVRQRFDDANPLKHGFLIHRHGLYTWGRDLDEARRHIEIFEFLFEVIGRSRLAGVKM